MSGIYFDEGVVLKSHSATTKNGKSVIKIELETRDHYDLASILRQLDKIEQERKAGNAVMVPVGRGKKPAEKPEQLKLPAPPRQIPYFPKED